MSISSSSLGRTQAGKSADLAGNSMNTNVVDLDDQMLADFRDEANDIINTIDVHLQNARSKPDAEQLSAIQREIFNLRYKGKSVSAPLINLTSHRFADYVTACKELTPAAIDDIQAFVDKIQKLLEGDMTAGGTDSAEFVRELPSKRTADIDPNWIKQTNIEALLVIPQRSMSAIVERELAACGYRSSVTHSSFEAIELAVHSRPDFIIVAKTIDELSGVDLTNALQAMPKTRSIPTAVLTSDAPNHQSLENLPCRTAIIRKGSAFGEDLAEALARFNIT
ncbi:response regulator [Thalassospira sp. MA62]|nr:response regulator [Thalassospira sp. MA62]